MVGVVGASTRSNVDMLLPGNRRTARQARYDHRADNLQWCHPGILAPVTH